MQNKSFIFEVSVTWNKLYTWKALSKISQKKMNFALKSGAYILLYFEWGNSVVQTFFCNTFKFEIWWSE